MRIYYTKQELKGYRNHMAATPALVGGLIMGGLSIAFGAAATPAIATLATIATFCAIYKAEQIRLTDDKIINRLTAPHHNKHRIQNSKLKI